MRMILLPVLVAAAAATANAQGLPRLTVRAENPSGFQRPDETVAVAWTEVKRALPTAAVDRIRVLNALNEEIVAQVVDNDGNGTLDELIFQASFWPNEVKSFTVRAEPSVIQVVPKVAVRHDDPRDDVAWESDRVAFRIYGEGLKKTPSAMSSAGIDVWQKSIKGLVVEKWYAKGHDAYHIDTGEGADFFDVGQTLGAGGVALWIRDTIYRPDNFKQWRIIATGPIRAIFELKYDPFGPAGGMQVSEVKRIAIDAGSNLYRHESIFTSTSTDITYATGLVKRPGMIGTFSRNHPHAWVAGWGPVAPKNGGHGELGTAVLISRDRLTDWKEAHNHYLGVAKATSGRPVVHWVGAGWTASGDFPTPQSWWAYLDRFAQRLAAPIKVTTQ
jgi:pectinesterase